MKLTQLASILTVSGVAVATAPDSVYGRSSIFKRWQYDVCSNDCSLRDVPMPDKNNFKLPLEGDYSEQCPPLILGPYNAPIATSRACLDFVGTNMYFNFSDSFAGYSIQSAVVAWKVKGNLADSAHWSSPPPTTNIVCSPPSASGGDYVCKLSFADILQVPSTTSIRDLMGGMCPNGDREALDFYLQLSGLAVPTGGGPAIPFTQQYPCTSRTGDRQCTAWDTSYPYIEVAYRCSKCEVAPCPTTTSAPVPSSSSTTTSTTTSSAPPSLKTCGFGTAFGYQNPVGGVPKSFTLNTQSGQGCNRWGWYETPTVAELQGGISGPLYVGAGGNDVSKAIDVGIWVATANALGRVTVTYLLNPPYALAEVHVNLACLPIAKCAPGQYTYNAGAIPNLPTWSNPTPLVYPSCSGGSKAALIVHAAVNILTVTGTCPPTKAS